jgi:hypothetical protein
MEHLWNDNVHNDNEFLGKKRSSFSQQILGIGMGGERKPSDLETGYKLSQLRHENLAPW